MPIFWNLMEERHYMSIVCIRNNNCVFICRNHVQNIHPCHHYLPLSSFSLLIQLPSSLTSCAHQVLVKILVSKNFVQTPAINQLQIQMNSIPICWSFKQGTFRVTEWKAMPWNKWHTGRQWKRWRSQRWESQGCGIENGEKSVNLFVLQVDPSYTDDTL